MISVSSFKQFLVEEDREIFFTFGRMNPPTTGHEKLIDTVARKAQKNPYKIFLSQSQDPKSNPIPYLEKVKLSRKMFPKHGRSILSNEKVKNVFDAAVNLYGQGYRKVTMVVGSDRVTEFQTLLNKYNGKKARHGFYNFERIRVISAGERDPDADDVSGVSASKQRAAAKNNDFMKFSQGVPKSMSNKDAKSLFNAVRVGMGLKEATEFKAKCDFNPVSEIREQYIQGDLYEVGDRVVIKKTKQAGHIQRLGTNYVIIGLDEGNISRQWIDSIIKEGTMGDAPEWGTPEATRRAKQMTPGESVEEDNTRTPQDKDIAGRKGSQPSSYHRGLSKDTKVKRDRQFKKQAKMRDDDPKAYKPAPGDKTAKTKPSKYTKAFKSMYGEDAVKLAKDKISKEKEADKYKHDKMMDIARLKKARRINRQTTPESKNPVAKYARKFNKAAVHVDKKKASKKGYKKHKGKVENAEV